MGKKRKVSAEDAPEGQWDCIDALDGIERDICFLAEILQLLYSASMQREAMENISLIHISSDMLQRLEQVKKLSRELFEHCANGNSPARSSNRDRNTKESLAA